MHRAQDLRRVAFEEMDLETLVFRGDRGSVGYSVHYSVLVVWDEDRDPRILRFLDDMPRPERDLLLAIYEHEGDVALLWAVKVPFGYSVGSEIKVGDDYWRVVVSQFPARG